MQKRFTRTQIEAFRLHLEEEEKAKATLEKYLRDVQSFFFWANGRAPEKKTVLAYKEHLSSRLAPASVNAALSSLNSFFAFIGHTELRVRMLRMQRQIFTRQEKELTKKEYERLLDTARGHGNERLYLLMQTVCASGIRVSELQYITVEAILQRKATIQCKGKLRVVILPRSLCKLLEAYAMRQGIKNGAVFITRTGKPLDRSCIWKMMKALCRDAGVSPEKVFPHNLRHLFARTFYAIQKDIVRLADILGHTSINTTRIYTMETGEMHRQQIQRLGLIRI